MTHESYTNVKGHGNMRMLFVTKNNLPEKSTYIQIYRLAQCRRVYVTLASYNLLLDWKYIVASASNRYICDHESNCIAVWILPVCVCVCSLYGIFRSSSFASIRKRMRHEIGQPMRTNIITIGKFHGFSFSPEWIARWFIFFYLVVHISISVFSSAIALFPPLLLFCLVIS